MYCLNSATVLQSRACKTQNADDVRAMSRFTSYTCFPPLLSRQKLQDSTHHIHSLPFADSPRLGRGNARQFFPSTFCSMDQRWRRYGRLSVKTLLARFLLDCLLRVLAYTWHPHDLTLAQDVSQHGLKMAQHGFRVNMTRVGWSTVVITMIPTSFHPEYVKEGPR